MNWRPQSKPGYMADLNEALRGRRIEYVDCETTFVAFVLDDGNRIRLDINGGEFIKELANAECNSKTQTTKT